MRIVAILMLFCAVSGRAVVLDRIAVVVGKHVIKTSDVERDIRVTDFLNQEPLNFSKQARRQAAERLVDQSVIRTEVATGGYSRATDSDAEALWNQILHQRFGGVKTRMIAELQRYGLTEDQLREQLLWQLTVLKFIQQRFQPGVVVSDDDIHTYYNQHLAELRRQYPRDSSFDTLEPKIRAELEGEAVNRDFEAWLPQARKRATVDFHEEAFQ